VAEDLESWFYASNAGRLSASRLPGFWPSPTRRPARISVNITRTRNIGLLISGPRRLGQSGGVWQRQVPCCWQHWVHCNGISSTKSHWRRWSRRKRIRISPRESMLLGHEGWALRLWDLCIWHMLPWYAKFFYAFIGPSLCDWSPLRTARTGRTYWSNSSYHASHSRSVLNVWALWNSLSDIISEEIELETFCSHGMFQLYDHEPGKWTAYDTRLIPELIPFVVNVMKTGIVPNFLPSACPLAPAF